MAPAHSIITAVEKVVSVLRHGSLPDDSRRFAVLRHGVSVKRISSGDSAVCRWVLVDHLDGTKSGTFVAAGMTEDDIAREVALAVMRYLTKRGVAYQQLCIADPDVREYTETITDLLSDAEVTTPSIKNHLAADRKAERLIARWQDSRELKRVKMSRAT